MKHERVPLPNFSALWDKKNSTIENRDITLWSIKYFDTRSSWNTKGFPSTEIFGTVRQKNFDGKSWYSPPLLSINFFTTGNFLKHSAEGFLYEIFRHCETKKFRQKIENRDITLWSIKYFDTRSSWNTKGFPLTEIFGTVRQKIFDGKSWYPLPPLWCINFFATRNCPIHRNVPQRNFSLLWDKKFWTKGRA